MILSLSHATRTSGHKRPQVRLLLLDIQRNADDSSLEQCKQWVGCPPFTLQEKCRFRNSLWIRTFVSFDGTGTR